MELVNPGIGLIFWMTLAFAALLWILAKFAWKPIMKSLHDREGKIEDSLQLADQTREEMKQLKIDNEALLKKAKEERDAILRDARNIKESIIDKARDSANEEYNRILERAREDIKNEKMAAITDLKNRIAQLSIEIAEKLLREELSKDEKQQELLKKLIDDVEIN